MIFFKKRYRKLLIGLLVSTLLLPVSLFAQSDDDGVANHLLADSLYLEDNLELASKKISPWSLNTSVGTSMAFMPGYGGGSSFFAAPHLDFSATKRLTLHGGMVASYGVPIYNSPDTEFGKIASYANLSAFVAASYRLTNDLVVYGTGMKSMMSSDMPGFNSGSALDDISFGAAYTIGNFTIGASFHSGPTNRYNRSPFNTGSGFYPSPIFW